MRKAAWTFDKKEREKAVQEAFQILQFLENELKAKFFGGDTPGIVDIAGDIIAFWLPIVQEVVGLQLLTIDNFPKLYQWTQDFINQPEIFFLLPSELASFERFAASK